MHSLLELKWVSSSTKTFKMPTFPYISLHFQTYHFSYLPKQKLAHLLFRGKYEELNVGKCNELRKFLNVEVIIAS